MYITKEIADRIKECLKLQNKSMGDMLSELNLGINTISEFSKGKQLSCISLAKIADYLNCSVDYLLGRENNVDIEESDVSEINYTDYVIGYVDILGTKALFDGSKSESELVQHYNMVYSLFIKAIKKVNTQMKQEGTNFEIKYKIFSDNILVAMKYDENDKQGVFWFISTLLLYFHVDVLLRMGLFLRGAITVGKMHISDNFVIGSGLVDVYTQEALNVQMPCIGVKQELYEKLRSDEIEEFTDRLNDEYIYLNFISFLKSKIQKSDLEIITVLYNVLNANKSNAGIDERALNKCIWFEEKLLNFIENDSDFSNEIAVAARSKHDISKFRSNFSKSERLKAIIEELPDFIDNVES